LRKNEKGYVRNGTFFFSPVDGLLEPTTGTGLQERVQNVLKKYGKLYYSLIEIFGPVLVNPFSQRKIRKIISFHSKKSIWLLMLLLFL
jgi:hypothetical protein